jgi:N6-adenosine-specific RNA methylase IME4
VSADVFAELNPPYATIVADPPWRFASAATKADARKHYSTMDLHDILALPVDSIAASSAHLWLWGVNGLMEEAYRVVRAWGFAPVTVVTWCKQAPGVGHCLRNNTEHIVFATRGKPMVPHEKPMTTWFQWDRGKHSRKPAAFYDLVQCVSPEPRVELFCREPIFGWDSWGYGYESAGFGSDQETKP